MTKKPSEWDNVSPVREEKDAQLLALALEKAAAKVIMAQKHGRLGCGKEIIQLRDAFASLKAAKEAK